MQFVVREVGKGGRNKWTTQGDSKAVEVAGDKLGERGFQCREDALKESLIRQGHLDDVSLEHFEIVFRQCGDPPRRSNATALLDRKRQWPPRYSGGPSTSR